MAKQRKSRKHRGVTLIKPNEARRTGWRARYVDPDTGKTKWETLPPPAQRQKGAREDWAVRLSDKLARRRLELEGGASPATGTPLPDAIQRYYTAHPHLRDTTVDTYSIGTDKLIAFARKRRIKTVDDLNRAQLMRLREQIINEPKQHATQGHRGQKVKGDDRRSAHSINRELRAVSTALKYLVDCDLFSKLSHDDIRRCCKPLKVSTERKDYLKTKQLQRLLEAALRHDAETFNATRAELARKGTTGRTPRYEPIAPVVTFCLLTGMRFSEVIDLDWKHVDLDALDSNGKKVGEIYITAASKTKKARTVGLEVSPALRQLLITQRMRTGGKGSVFGLTKGEAHAALRRLRKDYGAPEGSGWQKLRVTCATFLCNAPGIYGSASPFMESRQLGHSVLVAEKHYAGLIRGIPIEAKTLEAAMQIEKQCKQVIASVGKTRRQGRRAG